MSATTSPSASRPPIDWARVASYGVVLVLTVVYLGPLLMLLNTSFLTPAEFNRSPMTLPSSISFDNFFEAWDRANFAQYLLNSILYVVVSTTVFVVTGDGDGLVNLAGRLTRAFAWFDGFIDAQELSAMRSRPRGGSAGDRRGSIRAPDNGSPGDNR